MIVCRERGYQFDEVTNEALEFSDDPYFPKMHKYQSIKPFIRVHGSSNSPKRETPLVKYDGIYGVLDGTTMAACIGILFTYIQFVGNID